MKNKFVETQNVTALVSTAHALRDRDAGVPGLGLIHGPRGLGKTRTAVWYAARFEAIYLRSKSLWNPSWFLEELALEMGVVPKKSKKDLFGDVQNALKERPRLTIIDEINLPPTICLECIRDLHDITDAPFLMIGHEGIIQRLKRLGPFWDRFLYVTEFKALALKDLQSFASACLDVPAEDEALEKVLSGTGGNFRKSIVALKGMENQARLNGLQSITADLWRR